MNFIYIIIAYIGISEIRSTAFISDTKPRLFHQGRKSAD